MKLNKYTIGGLVCGLLGVVFLAIGIIMVAASGAIIRSQVNDQVALRQGGFTTDLWINPPYDIKMQFWAFSITNEKDVIENGEAPAVVEKGPYSYKEVQGKVSYQFDPANHRITYLNNKTYTFDPDSSCSDCRENDTMRTLDIPYLVALNLVRNTPELHNTAGNTIISLLLNNLDQENLFKSIAVGDMLYKGYPDILFKQIQCITGTKISFETVAKIVTCIRNVTPGTFSLALLNGETASAPTMSTQAPTTPPPACSGNVPVGDPFPDCMGIFYGKNHSNDGEYVINDGTADITQIGKVMTYLGKNALSFWNEWQDGDGGFAFGGLGQLANMINGSDGTLYPPFVQRTDTLRMFISDICRSLYVTYKEDVNIKGIPGYRFTLPASVFDSNLPENIGFCWPQDYNFFNDTTDPLFQQFGCLPPGLLNVSQCQPGGGYAPVVVSPPHFLFTPDYVQNSIQNLNPNGKPDEAQYGTNIDVEPTAGVPVAFSRKLQINVAIWPVKTTGDIAGLDKLPASIVPIVWLNESATIDDKTAQDVKDKVIIPQQILKIGSYVMMALGATILLVLVVIFGTYQYTLQPYRKMKIQTERERYNAGFVQPSEGEESAQATPKVFRNAAGAGLNGTPFTPEFDASVDKAPEYH